ncbi:unnamed protein product, partial [Clonostachys rosea f. rosea IK726]
MRNLPTVLPRGSQSRASTTINLLRMSDVHSRLLACFCLLPVQSWNDNGLANSASYLSTMLRTDGAPNDVLNNFNP